MIPIVFFVCVSAVMILRPLTKQLGRFLEAMTKERMQPPARVSSSETDIQRTLVLLEHVVKRLDGMEERLDFTERLMSGNQRGISSFDRSIRDMSDIGLRQEALHGTLR